VNSKEKQSEKLLQELLNLIQEAKTNFYYYVSKGYLNSEGVKIKIQIIKKYLELQNERSVLKYLNKNREEDFIKLINVIEKTL
jgi:chromosome condensin MukBEF MukE localization factor